MSIINGTVNDDNLTGNADDLIGHISNTTDITFENDFSFV